MPIRFEVLMKSDSLAAAATTHSREYPIFLARNFFHVRFCHQAAGNTKVGDYRIP